MKVQRVLIGVFVPAVLLLAAAISLTHAQGPEPPSPQAPQEALGTAFTYQGELGFGGEPVDGECEMEFRIYDHATNNSQVGAAITETVAISDGLFTQLLNFGNDAFTGDARWLGIQVQCQGDIGFTDLGRQALTPAPYALALPGLWTQQNITSTNLIGGYGGNSVAEGKVGATIGGGGSSGYPNQVMADYGTVGGGWDNTASGWSATVGGGRNNTASDDAATVGGGYLNTASDIFATVSGGRRNTASGAYATASGGYSNTVSGNYYATVSGGESNVASADHATVGGGRSNQAISSTYTTVGGGWGNTASGWAATVGGGRNNTASNDAAIVGGGYLNAASDIFATVSGGRRNTASGAYATASGGYSNTVSGNYYATIGGGESNVASGNHSTVPGGGSNTAQGDYSFAAGRQAKANNQGCFVWGDSAEADIACDNDNRWVARASDGVYFYTDSTLTSGSRLLAGGSAWGAVSDRARKENFEPVDTQELLSRLATIEISTWNYISQAPSIRHIGPMAQDFNALLPDLGGEGEEAINTLDADGVALAAIQGLYKQNQELQAQVNDLEARLEALEAREPASPTRSSFLPWWAVLLAGIGLAWLFTKEHIVALVWREAR